MNAVELQTMVEFQQGQIAGLGAVLVAMVAVLPAEQKALLLAAIRSGLEGAKTGMLADADFSDEAIEGLERMSLGFANLLEVE